jgi:hypothetical protein
MTKRVSVMIFFISIILLMQNRTSFSQEIDQEEYKIYQVIIETKYLSKPGYIDWLNHPYSLGKEPKELLPKTVIIISETVSFFMKDSEIMNSLITDMKTRKKLIDSWNNINTKTYILKDFFSFSTKHLVISTDQLWEALNPSRWISFYERYPDALGIFELTRVAFDDNKTSALVYVINIQDGKWGSSTFYFLTKSDNQEWKIVKEYVALIS